MTNPNEDKMREAFEGWWDNPAHNLGFARDYDAAQTGFQGGYQAGRTFTQDDVERVARGIMNDEPCGCTVDGEHVFCFDGRLPTPSNKKDCVCLSGAKAALEAIGKVEG